MNRSPWKRRVVWIFSIPLGVITLLVLAAWIAWVLHNNHGRQELAVKIQRLQDAGWPIGNDQLSQHYIDNTSDLDRQRWDELFIAMKSAEFQDSCLDVPRLDQELYRYTDGDPEIFDTSESWIHAEASILFTRDQSDLIQLARELAEAQNATYFPIHFQSIETLLPQVQNTRIAARMLVIDAQVALHQDDTQRAVSNIVALTNLSKHTDAVPFAVSHLTGISIRRNALEVLQHALQRDVLSHAQLQQIDTSLAPYCDVGPRWKACIQGELASLLPLVINPDGGMNISLDRKSRGHDAAYFINIFERAASIPSDQWENLLSTTKQLESDLARDTSTFLGKLDLLMTGLLTPSLTSIAAMQISNAQLHRQARVAIALRLHAQNHGRFPTSLTDLPQASTNLSAYGGKLFGYSVTENTPILWGSDMSRKLIEIPESPAIPLELDPLLVWRLPNTTDGD